MKQLSWFDYFFKLSKISKSELRMLSLRMKIYNRNGFDENPYNIIEMNDYDFIIYYRHVRIRSFVSKLSKKRFNSLCNRSTIVYNLPDNIEPIHDDYYIINQRITITKPKNLMAANIANHFFDMEMAFVSGAYNN